VVGRIRTSPTVKTADRLPLFLDCHCMDRRATKAPQHRMLHHARKVEAFVHADLHRKLKAEAEVDLKQSDAQQRRDPHRDGYQELGNRL